MLSLLHTIYKKKNKRQENVNISNRRYYIQDIKYVKHKNINMTWYYQNFPRHPVAAEKLKIIGINTIPFHYNYRVDPEIGKGVCEIHRIPCALPACVYQLDIYW